MSGARVARVRPSLSSATITRARLALRHLRTHGRIPLRNLLLIRRIALRKLAGVALRQLLLLRSVAWRQLSGVALLLLSSRRLAVDRQFVENPIHAGDSLCRAFGNCSFLATADVSDQAGDAR